MHVHTRAHPDANRSEGEMLFWISKTSGRTSVGSSPSFTVLDGQLQASSSWTRQDRELLGTQRLDHSLEEAPH